MVLNDFDTTKIEKKQINRFRSLSSPFFIFVRQKKLELCKTRYTRDTRINAVMWHTSLENSKPLLCVAPQF